MKNWQKLAILSVSVVLLTGCTRNWLAPSANLSGGNYTVQSGDTLNSIAYKFKVSPKSIVSYNNLSAPYRIRAGQTLLIKDMKSNYLPPAVSEPVDEPAPVSSTPTQVVNNPAPNSLAAPIIGTVQPSPGTISTRVAEGITWSWPTKGSLISPNSTGVQKGIDIAGIVGQPIYAAASGQVLFSGVGSTGYGNMIIIKHASNFLTAYGNNQKLMVKEGQQVSRGQQIATMGQNQQIAELHFEVRQSGVAVDPTNYLPSN
ncbi:MAG: peptidoglycan DD-metalloendopeptidase family protein [Gammaproteobacteria bacterium]|nr:peptidoglycan DD-metalloendopeptidase family protein [Gammaproteobacteria bacterium]